MSLGKTKRLLLCKIFDNYAVYAVSREEDKMFRHFVEKLGVRWASGEKPSRRSYWHDDTIVIFTLFCTSSGKMKMRCGKRRLSYLDEYSTIYGLKLIPVSTFIAIVNKIVGINANNIIYTKVNIDK